MQTVRSIPPMRAIKYPPYARVGFVPTMGFLHEGHLSLVDEARKTCDVVVVSIFVNPAQFGPQEDLASYPRDLERDLALLEDHKVDYVFFPSSLTMYPDGYRTWVNVSGLSDLLCGASRPGHFNLSVKIMGCPIIREADGLAKSSRNVYLKGEQRQQASCLYQALINSRQMVKAGERDAGRIIAAAETILISNGARPDYIEIVNSRDLSQTTKIDENSRMLIAAWVGTPRLIDNMPLKT